MTERIKNILDCVPEIHFKYKPTYDVKASGWRKIYTIVKAEIDILISDITYFRTRKVITHYEGHYIMMESIL